MQLGEKPPKKVKRQSVKGKSGDKKAKGENEKVKGTRLEVNNSNEKVNSPVMAKPKMASIPKGVDPSKVTVADAMKYLSLPRNLGTDPKTGKDVMASAGRFGPYVGSDGNFRSVKVPDNVYDITLERALELLAIPKKPRGFQKKK